VFEETEEEVPTLGKKLQQRAFLDKNKDPLAPDYGAWAERGPYRVDQATGQAADSLTGRPIDPMGAVPRTPGNIAADVGGGAAPSQLGSALDRLRNTRSVEGAAQPAPALQQPKPPKVMTAAQFLEWEKQQQGANQWRNQ
jgi:hypothetical protein